MPIVAANGIELYYERRGSGPRLLFFNGSGATLRTSGALLLKPFTSRFEVVAHDQRGLGQTSVPDGPYTMADYAADGAALLDAHRLGLVSRVSASASGAWWRRSSPSRTRRESNGSRSPAPRREAPAARRTRSTSWRRCLLPSVRRWGRR